MSIATDISLLDCAPIRSAFEEWQTEQAPLEAELRESLAALMAFQSQLDDWQQRLVRDRQELAADREQFAREQAELQASQAEANSETAAELIAAREKMASLTSALLARTEELRNLDDQRAAAVSELELARARERELTVALEELKQTGEQERRQSADELRQLRELLETRMETSDGVPRAAEAEPPRATRSKGEPHSRSGNSPVLGSIVEQFGKLRQQRAQDRSAHQKRGSIQ